MKFDLNIKNINYVKITYKDKSNFSHCIKAAVRLLTESEFLACIRIQEDFDIKVPQEVELRIACENGLYKSKALLKKIDKDVPYLLFVMKKPEEMEYQQKREYFRVKLQENVTVIYDVDEQLFQISALTYDISANGVRIELEKKINFPQYVKLILHLPDNRIEVGAKYIRTDDEDKQLKASFHFVDISQADTDYISQICFAKQLEERRKNLM